MKKVEKILLEHIKFVINTKISLVELSSKDDYDELFGIHRKDDYDEGYLDALDFVLNLIAEEEELI